MECVSRVTILGMRLVLGVCVALPEKAGQPPRNTISVHWRAFPYRRARPRPELWIPQLRSDKATQRALRSWPMLWVSSRVQALLRQVSPFLGNSDINFRRRTPRLVQEPAHHRLKGGHRLIPIGWVERDLIIFGAEIDSLLIPGFVLKLVAGIGVKSQVRAEEIGLEQSVILEEVVVILRNKRMEDRSGNLAVIHRTECLTHIMEESGYD